VTTCSQLWRSGRSRRARSGGSARRGVKFLVDAQLPARLARFFAGAGHDVVHTSELPDGNRTSDARIAEVADDEGRVVVTKDRDFRDGHLLSGSPRRLLVVATGNITNAALLGLFEANLDAVVGALGEADFVELGPEAMVVHKRRGPR
jgi:predicted nuclease of predicted toxin-antitoxin system